MIGAFIELSLTREPCDTENIKMSSVKTIPVVLGGTEEDPISLKWRVIEDSDDDDDTSFQWPPPRTKRQIAPHTSVRSLRTIKTFPAFLKPVRN